MLLVDVHELNVIFADSSCALGLEDQIDNIWRILRLDGEDVVASSSTQHLCERSEVDTERDVAVAAEGRESFELEHHGNESDVRVVHGLERDTRVIAVEVAVLYEVLDGIDDLLSVRMAYVKLCCANVHTFFRTLAWFKRASSTADY